MPLSPLPDLFDFHWERLEGGYALDADAGPTARMLEAPRRFRPAGSVAVKQRYRPAEAGARLHRDFIEAPSTAAGMLDFVNRCGLLTPYLDDVQGMLAQQRELAAFATTIDQWREIASRSKKPLGGDGTAGVELGGLFNALSAAHCRVVVDTSNPQRLGLRVVPENLLAFLWCKFADELTGGVEYRPCERCGKPIELRSEGQKNQQRFCSVACRMAAHRLAKKEREQ